MSDSFHLVCPHCLAVNRLSSARLNEQPNCGRCHQPIFTGHPVDLTSASFNKHIVRNDVPVLVDFWAEWCGPCKMMAPAFVEASRALEPAVRLAKIDTAAEPGISSSYGVRSIPTLILFQNGRELARQSGAMPASDIIRWTRHRLGMPEK